VDDQDENEDLRQPVPRDAVHDLIMSRLLVLERENKQFAQWQYKKDLMFETFSERLIEHGARLGSAEEHLRVALDDQTKTLMREFGSLKDNIDRVVAKQTFWENVIKVLRWVGGVIAGAAFVIWTMGTFFWEHFRTTPK
jgi:hypothetical protein